MTISEHITILSQDFIRESKIVVLWHHMLFLHNDILGILLENYNYNISWSVTPELNIFQLTSLGLWLGPTQHFLLIKFLPAVSVNMFKIFTFIIQNDYVNCFKECVQHMFSSPITIACFICLKLDWYGSPYNSSNLNIRNEVFSCIWTLGGHFHIPTFG